MATNEYKSRDCLSNFLNERVKREENGLPHDEFVARIGTIHKRLLLIGAVLMFLIGLPICLLCDTAVGVLCFVMAGGIAALLPTFFSYQCTVNQTVLKEEYLLLFIRKKKEVLWNNIKYKKRIVGKNNAIIFYDQNRKKVLSFDIGIVGFGRLVKMANGKSIRNIDAEN